MKQLMQAPTRGARRRVARAALVLTLPWLAGCSGDVAAGTGPGGAAAPAPGAPVSVARVERRDVPLLIAAIGTVESPASVTLKPQVEGRVVELHFTEGDDVKAGDVLVVLDQRPAQAAVQLAEASVAKDRAMATDAALAAEQMGSVNDTRAVSQRTLQQARATSDAAQAAVSAEQALLETARLRLEYCTIRAPFDGRTGALGVHVGSVVKADETALLTIHQIAPIRVSFTVPQGRLPAIRARQAHASLGVLATPAGGAPVRGTLTFIDNAVDSSTGTIRLMATYDNVDRGLWPGQYVDVSLELDVDRGALVVPQRAVQTGQQGRYVFVVGDDRSVALRSVEVARDTGDLALIGSGLSEGQTVVTDGQLRLVDGARVSFDG